MVTPQSLLPRPGILDHSVQVVLTVPKEHEWAVCSASGSWVSQAVGWDSNPNVLKDPAPRAPVLAYCHSRVWSQRASGWQGVLQCPLSLEWLFAFFPQHSGRGLFSPTVPGSGLQSSGRLPPPQVHKEAGESPAVKNWFFLHFFLFPNPSFFSCPNTTFHFCNVSFAFFCLSAEGDPSPPFLRCLFYLSQFEIMHLWPITLSPWAPEDVSVTL